LSQGAVGRSHFTTLFQEKLERNIKTYSSKPVSQRMERKQIHDLIKELKNLQLREAEITKQIDEANAALSGHRGATVEHDFEKGDRVRVTNQVKKPTNWGDDYWNYQQAKVATVTFITTDRIFFVTDNGIKTWRAPRNLVRINHQNEHARTNQG
jgi:hypothetical protein